MLGRNNVETAKLTDYAPNSLTQNYVTAHLASTGVYKVPADSIQHAWRGREGLRPVYDREIETLRRLSEAVRNRPAVNPAPMAERLQAMGQRPLTEPVAELSELFEWFQKTVSDDMQKTLRELAQDQGAMLKNGDVNMAYRAKNHQRPTCSMKSANSSKAAASPPTILWARWSRTCRTTISPLSTAIRPR